MTGEPTTVTELLLARARDHHDGLLFEERSWSWAEHVVCSARYAAALRAVHKPGTPCHIGLLADNVPEFSFLLGGCAFSGAVLVGLNPVRRGAALARDIRLADCRLVIAERTYLPLLRGLDLGGAEVLELGSSGWHDFLAAGEAYAGDPVPAAPDDLLMLIFTSGTSGDPKAVRCTHAKVTMPGIMLSERFDLSTADTAYVAMPMFHSNAIMAGWSVGLAAGATLALRRRFSASGFLPDIRRYDATYANYVGKPLSYVLATEVLPDDADNPLRIMYGNEGSSADLRRFAERFGCHVVDGFGSSEGGIAITRTPDTPHAALGPLPPDVRILSEDSGLLCPPALLDEHGGLCNGNEAIGELVNVSGAGAFAGYYKNEDADRARLRGGRYHSGDLAYADADGYCYFAGRSSEWLRVDGENLGTAPIERVLLRHPGIAEVAVYALPDDHGGDRVTAAVVLRPGIEFHPGNFSEFLATQPDLGPKQRPSLIRICQELPRTATYKVLKRALAEQAYDCADPLWRHERGQYLPHLTPA